MSVRGRVGRPRWGLVLRGTSYMADSCSVFDRLFVRARGTAGTGGAERDGGTTSSGSKKYIHLFDSG